MSTFFKEWFGSMLGLLVVLSLFAGIIGGAILSATVGWYVIQAGGGWLAIPAGALTFFVCASLGFVPWRLTT